MKIIILWTVLVLLQTGALAQSAPKPSPAPTSTSQASITKPNPDLTNVELDDLKKQLTELREKLAASEAREQIRSEVLYNRLGWTGFLFGGLGVSLGFITLSPVIGGLLLWAIRRNIYREIARPIETEINASLDSTRNTLGSLVGRVEVLDRTTIPAIQSMAQNLENKYEEVKQEIITSGEIINRVKKQLDIGLATEKEKTRLKEDINKSPSFVQDNIFYSNPI
jgi:hypothetical protein